MTAKTASAIYIAKKTLLRLTNTRDQGSVRQIRNMSQETMGVIRLESQSQMIGENLTFTLNKVLTDRAGVIAISEQSLVNLTNTTFIGNDAKDKGGCIFLTDNSRFSCN